MASPLPSARGRPLLVSSLCLCLCRLLELILKIARTELKADRGSVFLLDHKSGELWSIVASGLEHKEIRIPVGRGVAGTRLETGDGRQEARGKRQETGDRRREAIQPTTSSLQSPV